MSELAAEIYNNKFLNRIVKMKEATIVGVGIILTDLLAHNEASVQAGSSVLQHIEKGLPSAFATPNIGSDVLGIHNPVADKVIDIGVEAGPAVASIAFLRNAPEKTSLKELAGIGVVAQGLAVSGDAVLAQEHLLSPTERHTPDNGFSAIYIAYITKLVLDRIGRTESERQRWLQRGFAAMAAGALILATSLIDKDNLLTDTISHAAGVLTGAGASALGQRDKTGN